MKASHSTRLWLFLLAILATAQTVRAQTSLDRLIAAYPDALEKVDGGDLVWRDGTRMRIDDGGPTKTPAARISAPDIKDMLTDAYPAGGALVAPAIDVDPGRSRNAAFFSKLYGDCKSGTVSKKLVEVPWLPGHGGGYVRVTALHGVAERLAAVSARLDKLPAAFDTYLLHPAGGYACRPIVGTARRSAHGYGIAVDINTKHAHYWRWSKGSPSGVLDYQNEIPQEIVAAFEAEGFIWGGRWYHYDTMHFEYRPELFAARK